MPEELDLAWGAKGIGKEINRSPSQTAYLLAIGAMRCARRVGKQWVADRQALLREFSAPAENSNTVTRP
jgi:hypothetical protein